MWNCLISTCFAWQGKPSLVFYNCEQYIFECNLVYVHADRHLKVERGHVRIAWLLLNDAYSSSYVLNCKPVVLAASSLLLAIQISLSESTNSTHPLEKGNAKEQFHLSTQWWHSFGVDDADIVKITRWLSETCQNDTAITNFVVNIT